jgi:four helix bundle protein
VSSVDHPLARLPFYGNPQLLGDLDHTGAADWSVRIEQMQGTVQSIVRSYRDLVVWKKSMALVLDVYRSTQSFPRTETYGLVSQLRRAAVSVPSNIAEGQARLTTGEFKQFLGQARLSLMEVETQIVIARELGYLAPAESAILLSSAAEVGRILNGLLKSLPSSRSRISTR